MKKTVLILITLLGLTGCEGSFDSAYNAFRSPKNSIPAVYVENISGWQTSPVTVTGSAKDPDNDSLTYSWSEVSSFGVTFTTPAGSSTGVVFSVNASGDVAVNAVIRLTVSDGEDESHYDMTLKIYRNDVIFVTQNGVTGGSGNSPDSPLSGGSPGEIASAITYAKNSSRKIVALAEGLYQINSNINLVEGISLYGGYSSTDWSRNIAAEESIIRDMNVYTGANVDGAANGAILTNDHNITTKATAINGIVIEIGRGIWASGISCYSTTGLTIKNCSIRNRTDGTDNNSAQQFGIFLRTCGEVIIERCNITLGVLESPSSGSVWSVGIGLFNSGNVYIEGNKIYPGRAKTNGTSGTNSYGIHLMSIANTTTLTAVNNLISSGISERGNSMGIYFNTSTIADYTYTVQNNTISAINPSDVAANNTSACIRTSTSTGTINIDNNMLIAAGVSRSYCLYMYSTFIPDTLRNNLFYTAPSTSSEFVYTGVDAITYNDLSTVIPSLGYSLLSRGNITENLSNYLVDYEGPDNDIATLSDNDWHVVKTIHTPMNLLYGGLDLSASLLKDFDGNPRTNLDALKATNGGAGGLTIGAYEKD